VRWKPAQKGCFPVNEAEPKLSRALLMRIFIPFGFGYYLSYLYRVVNAVMAPDLVADMGVDPSDLGLLTAAYFLTFAAFQLPLGVLLDRFGPRRIESLLLLFAGLGAVVFSRAGSLAGLVAGRALIGFGVSACLMASFKAYVMWFPRRRLPLINGLQMAAGGMGALSATAPVEAMLGIIHWRGIFNLLAALTLVIAAMVFWIVPEKDPGSEHMTLGRQLNGIAQVFTSMTFWRIAPVATLSQAAFLSIHGLWLGPWLRDVAGFGRSRLAGALVLVAIAMMAGFVSLGAAAERLGKSGVPPVVVAVGGMSAFMCMQLVVVIGFAWWAVPVWMLFGYFGTSGIICYAVLSQNFPVHLTGRANTALNLMVFVAAFIAQWAMGAVIEIWPVTARGEYHPAGYQVAFGIMLALQILALIWFFLAGRKAGQA
jgi:predicted MFS family arabinose efflux permease